MAPKINKFAKSAICITLGEQSENHPGMIKYGKGLARNGYTVDELKAFKEKYDKIGTAEYIDLTLDNIEAGVLILRNGVNKISNIESNKIFEELKSLDWDKKYYDTRRSKVLNKNARWNLCFGDKEIAPDYENKKGRVISYDNIQYTKQWKKSVEAFIDEKDLEAEGNYYYDVNKCGIGYHGDSERKKVIAANFGESRNIVWVWYQHSERISDKFSIILNCGDMYIMSEKASGWDWNRRNSKTIRHGAGAKKYIV